MLTDPCVHEEISHEVQVISESDGLPVTFSSRAAFTNNERITEGESMKGQTMTESICFDVKQGSSCLYKGNEKESSELSSPQQISCLPKSLGMPYEDLNNGSIISKGKLNMAKLKRAVALPNSKFSFLFIL